MKIVFFAGLIAGALLGLLVGYVKGVEDQEE